MRNSSAASPGTGRRRSVPNGSGINAGGNRAGEAKPKVRKPLGRVGADSNALPNRKPLPNPTNSNDKKSTAHTPLVKKSKGAYSSGKKNGNKINKYMLTPQISDMNKNLLRKISSARLPVSVSGRRVPSGGTARHSLENNTSMPLFAANSPYMGREFSPEEVDYYNCWAPFKAPNATTVQQLSVEDRLLLLGVRPGSTAAQLCEHWEQQLTRRFLGDEDFSFLDQNSSDSPSGFASSWPARREKHSVDKSNTWWAPLTIPEALMNSMRPSTTSPATAEKKAATTATPSPSPPAAAPAPKPAEEPVAGGIAPPSPHSHIPYPPLPIPRNSVDGSNTSASTTPKNSIKRASGTKPYSRNSSKGHSESSASEPPWVKNTTPQGVVHTLLPSDDDPTTGAAANEMDDDETGMNSLPSPPKHKKLSLSSPHSGKPNGSSSSNERSGPANKVAFSEGDGDHDGPHRTAHRNSSNDWVGQNTIDRKFNQLENDVEQLTDFQRHQRPNPPHGRKASVGSYASEEEDEAEARLATAVDASGDRQPSPSTINRKFTELEGDLENMKVESPRRRRSMQRNASTDPKDKDEEPPGALKEADAVRLNRLLGDSVPREEEGKRRPKTSPAAPAAIQAPLPHKFLPGGRVVVMSLGPIAPIASDVHDKPKRHEEAHSSTNSIAGSPMAYGPKKKNNAGRRLPPIQ